MCLSINIGGGGYRLLQSLRCCGPTGMIGWESVLGAELLVAFLGQQ